MSEAQSTLYLGSFPTSAIETSKRCCEQALGVAACRGVRAGWSCKMAAVDVSIVFDGARSCLLSTLQSPCLLIAYPVSPASL